MLCIPFICRFRFKKKFLRCFLLPLVPYFFFLLEGHHVCCPECISSFLFFLPIFLAFCHFSQADISSYWLCFQLELYLLLLRWLCFMDELSRHQAGVSPVVNLPRLLFSKDVSASQIDHWAAAAFFPAHAHMLRSSEQGTWRTILSFSRTGEECLDSGVCYYFYPSVTVFSRYSPPFEEAV